MAEHLVSLGLFLLVAASGVWADDNDDDYDKLFLDVDIDSILNNDRILDSYVHCFLNTGHCSDRAEKAKRKIPEVFETVCGMCTEKQKDIFKHCLEVFIPKRPDDWKKILEIYDPEGKFWPGIKKFLDTPRR